MDILSDPDCSEGRHPGPAVSQFGRASAGQKYKRLDCLAVFMSKQWMADRRRDHYYKLAKAQNYRSRAAFKLRQINEKFKVMKTGDVVLDLGANPGGWSQVAIETVGNPGKVLAIDIKGIEPIDGVHFYKGDVRAGETKGWIRENLGGRGVNLVISDMSPNITGNYSMDHARSMELAEMAFEFARAHLAPGGNMVIKLFDGDMTRAFVDAIRLKFRMVKRHSPKASRSSSSEVYIIAKGYKGR